LEPLLATTWSHTTDTEWTFHIATGIKFHNGHALTPAIVRDSLLAATNNPALDKYTSTIAVVEAQLNSDRVVVSTTVADPTLPNKLAYILIYDTTATKKIDAANGTGPYQIKPGTTPTADHIRLSAIDKYHGKYQWVREIDVSATDSKVADLYAQNQVDVGAVSYMDKLDGRGYGLMQSTSLTNWLLLPNTRHVDSPLVSAAARRAVATAVDSAALIKSGNLTGAVATQILPVGVPGYVSSITKPTGNKARVQQLLSNAGVPADFTLKLAYAADQAPLAVLIKSQLEADGISVTLAPAADNVALAVARAGGTADLYLTSVTTQYLDGADVFKDILHSNLYLNQAIDQLTAELNATYDVSKRASLLQQIETAAADDVAIIPVYSPSSDLFVVDPSYNIHKDVPGPGLGVYFQTVYASR
jgi:peptide/nickel transport system substrate-binding protein